MSRYSSADVGFMLVSGLNVLSDLTDIEDNREAIIEEITPISSANETHAYVGVKRFELTQRGFYNDDADRINAALVTPGASKILSFAPEGNTLGKIAACVGAVQVDYKRRISRAEMHKADASYRAEYGYDEARILHALGAETADGDGEAAAYDGDALSSAGGVGYLQVTAITLGGYDDVTIEILDDADNSGSFGNLLTFSDVTAVGAQRVAVSGTVERYLTWRVTFNGAGSDPSITFMVAFKRN